MGLAPYFFTTRRDPRSIPNMTLWLDASDSSSLFDATTGGSTPAADAAVARIVDKGPSAFAFTQGTVNNRPLRRVASLNGLDGIQFDGANDSLYALSNVFDTGVSCMAVVKLASATNRAPIVDINSGTSGVGANPYFVLEANTFSTAGSRWGIYTCGSSADSTLSTSTNAACVLLAANATNGNAIISNTDYRRNGAVSGAMTLKSGVGNFYDLSVSGNSGTMIGSYNNAGTSTVAYGAFTLYELAVWNRRLTAAECAFLESYVARKWSVAI